MVMTACTVYLLDAGLFFGILWIIIKFILFKLVPIFLVLWVIFKIHGFLFPDAKEIDKILDASADALSNVLKFDEEEDHEEGKS